MKLNLDMVNVGKIVSDRNIKEADSLMELAKKCDDIDALMAATAIKQTIILLEGLQ